MIEKCIQYISDNTDNKLKIWEIVLISSAVCGLLHAVYFMLAPYIWNQNLQFDPQEITPWIRQWTHQRDGIEIYALYILMFSSIFISLATTRLWKHITNIFVYSIIILLFAVSAFIFFATIGFHPPMSTIAMRSYYSICKQLLYVASILVPIMATLLILRKVKINWALNLMILAILIPVCLTAIQPISWKDYSFIFAPALRLLHGADFSEVYFQYDILLSLLVLPWAKLRLDLNLFQIVGQASYLLYFFSAFLLSQKLCCNKKLPIFFLSALVLIRIYAALDDPTGSIQVTPLRLDWWLLLLILVHRFGPYHWSTGLFCGLMIILHKNFGIIYTIAYFQLIITLFSIELLQSKTSLHLTTLWEFILKSLRSYLPNLTIIALSSLVGIIVFNGDLSDSVYYYQKLGIGFIKIHVNSFYWYAPPVVCFTFILCLRLWKVLRPEYRTTCLLLIFLAFGNSIYFFGRSHENNILHISGPFILILFILIDLLNYFKNDTMGSRLSQFIKRNLACMASIGFILLILIYYGDKICDKVAIQVANAKELKLNYHQTKLSKGYTNNIINRLKIVTGNSEKVFFASLTNDVIFYYYSEYAPVGYFNPFMSWIFKKDLHHFLQDLIDKEYFIVVDCMECEDVFSRLIFSKIIRVDDFVIISK